MGASGVLGPYPFSQLTGSASIAQYGATTYAVTQYTLVATGVNFNSANSDTIFPITLPTGFTRFVVSSVRISGASASLTTATCGVFSQAAGAGIAIVTGATAITVSTASEETANNTQALTIATGSTTMRLSAVPNVYFRVQTAQGSAATANVIMLIIAHP